jgi:hypothetical protein
MILALKVLLTSDSQLPAIMIPESLNTIGIGIGVQDNALEYLPIDLTFQSSDLPDILSEGDQKIS